MKEVTHKVDPQTVATSLRKRREQQTVGYGERYPQPSTDHIVAEDSNVNGGVHHRNQSNEYAFDLTSFGSGSHGVQNFLAVLKEAGLRPVEDHYRVFRDMGRGIDTDYRDRFVFAWANASTLVVCTNNPVTGESNGPNIISDQGDAGYVGVAGDASRVDDVIEAINKRGTTKSEMRAGSLFY